MRLLMRAFSKLIENTKQEVDTIEMIENVQKSINVLIG